jgi:hypothetical protein
MASRQSAQEKLIPHWRGRLPAILAYPFRPEVLPALLMLTLVNAAAGFIPIMGLVVSIAVTLTAYKFAFEILRRSADGWDEPPEAMFSVENSVVGWYMLVLFTCAACVWVAGKLLGTAAGWSALLVLLVLQPAFTITLVIEANVASALNPLRWLELMQRMAGGYFAVAGLLLLTQLAELWMTALLSGVVPDLLANGLRDLFSLWGLFAAAHWMGYLLWQYHHELGYEPGMPKEKVQRAPDRDQALLERMELLCLQGDAAAARQAAADEIRERAVSPAVHARLRELLQRAGDGAAIGAHAQGYLHRLLIDKDYRRAVELALQEYARDPGFAPPDPEQGSVLAAQAAKLGQSRLQADVLRSLLAHYPKEPFAPDWALSLSGLLATRMDRAAEAGEVLERAIGYCRDDAARERLQQARAALPAAS